MCAFLHGALVAYPGKEPSLRASDLWFERTLSAGCERRTRHILDLLRVERREPRWNRLIRRAVPASSRVLSWSSSLFYQIFRFVRLTTGSGCGCDERRKDRIAYDDDREVKDLKHTKEKWGFLVPSEVLGLIEKCADSWLYKESCGMIRRRRMDSLRKISSSPMNTATTIIARKFVRQRTRTCCASPRQLK